MSEKPQEVREDEHEDLLEQIITQGLDRMRVPVQTVDAGEPPSSETPPTPKQEAAPFTGKNNRRSAVYLYLLILFGAAFLMLLLAYFIQRRSSEDAISDLRDSMNLSRAELLAQIKKLEELNASMESLYPVLEEGYDRLKDELAQLQVRYEEKDQEASDNWDLYIGVWEELNSWNSFWMLEQYYQEGNYESCATILLLQRQGQFPYQTPKGAQERQAEIVQAVIDEGILNEDYYLHPDNYNDLLDAHYSDVLDRLAESGMARGWARDVSRETER